MATPDSNLYSSASSTEKAQEDNSDKPALPSYLCLLIFPEIAVNNNDVRKGVPKLGNGGNSDEEASIVDNLYNPMMEANSDRLQQLIEGGNDAVLVADNSITASLLHKGDCKKATSTIAVPGTPSVWEAPKPKTDHGESPHPFKGVNNPGDWSNFIFCPIFTSKLYKQHLVPTGAYPVKLNLDDNRKIGGGNPITTVGTMTKNHCSGATVDNMFPEECQGCLDANLLAKFGLSKQKWREPMLSSSYSCYSHCAMQSAWELRMILRSLSIAV